MDSAEEPKITLTPTPLFWITGMAGAGKTTIAELVVKALREKGVPVVFLDGDIFRVMMGSDLGYTPEDRKQNAWRIARFSQFLSCQQSIPTVIATVSLYEEVRTWLRENTPGYKEVFVKVSDEVLRSRDKKGLYSGVESGEVTHVAGLDQEIQLPSSPDLVIENNETNEDFSGFVLKIIELIQVKH